MKTNWIFKSPIDLEHKQYVLLDYLQKVEKEITDLKLYPAFQQITLHLANVNLAQNKTQYLTIIPKNVEPDQEILLSEIKYHSPRNITEEDREVIKDIVTYSKERLTHVFLIAKSLWEIVNESISLNLIKNSEQIMTGSGYFKFTYDNKLHVYEYRLRSEIPDDLSTQKLFVNEIYCGEPKGLYQLTVDNTTFFNPDITKEDLVKLLPLFEVNIDQKFPLKESLLPLIKRKVTNYILQTVKINEIKEITKDGN